MSFPHSKGIAELVEALGHEGRRPGHRAPFERGGDVPARQFDSDGGSGVRRRLEREESRGAVPIRRRIDVVRAHAELVGVEPVTDLDDARAPVGDLPGVLSDLSMLYRLSVGEGKKSLDMACVLANQVRTGRPGRHEEPEG